MGCSRVVARYVRHVVGGGNETDRGDGALLVAWSDPEAVVRWRDDAWVPVFAGRFGVVFLERSEATRRELLSGNLRDALIETFSLKLRAVDRLWMPEIYYAGGTVTKDISSRDIVDAVRAKGAAAHFCEQREEIVGAVAAAAQPGDLVLVMGARDPSLTDFCQEIVGALESSGP